MYVYSHVDIIKRALATPAGRHRMGSAICRLLEKNAGHELDTYDLVMGALELPENELTQELLGGAIAYEKGQEAQLT